MARVLPTPAEFPQLVSVRLIAIPHPQISSQNIDQHRRRRIEWPRRRQFKSASHRLKGVAIAEAHHVLRKALPHSEIWSHAFEFEGQEFLLSARIRPAREVAAALMIPADGSSCTANQVLPPRLIIEVVQAPSGLT